MDGNAVQYFIRSEAARGWGQDFYTDVVRGKGLCEGEQERPGRVTREARVRVGDENHPKRCRGYDSDGGEPGGRSRNASSCRCSSRICAR